MGKLSKAGTTDIAHDYENDSYYDTDGNASLIKSEKIVYNSEEMQFIAVTTRDGHVFYVLINYSDKNGEDNVYFLNHVDDYDLYVMSLMMNVLLLLMKQSSFLTAARSLPMRMMRLPSSPERRILYRRRITNRLR